MVSEKIAEFVSCLKEQRYYDAHEVLEDIWFPRRFDKCDETNLLKAFINASVSFELYKRGRVEQSKKAWRNYLKHRGLLLKVDSEYKNHYYQLSRYIESINENKKSLIRVSLK